MPPAGPSTFAHALAVLRQAQASPDVVDATAGAYRALHLFEQVPSRRGRGLAHLTLAGFCLDTADLAEARDHAAAARDRFAEIPLPRLEAHARQLLGDILIRFGDLSGADQEFRAAMAIRTEHGEAGELAGLHRRMGSLERRRGHLSEAMKHYLLASSVYSDLGDEHGQAGVLLSLGNTLAAVGEYQAATAAYQESRHLFAESGDWLGVGNACRFLGQALTLRGDPAAGDQQLVEALAAYTEVEDILGIAHCHLLMAASALEAADDAGAEKHARQAIDLFARLSDPISLVKSVRILTGALQTRHDDAAVLEALAWGVAEARQAARWTVDEAASHQAREMVADLEKQALHLAVKLEDAAQAGVIMETAVSGVIGLLPMLLDAPPSGDPRVEDLRAQVRGLAQRLAAGRTQTPDGDEQPEQSTPDGDEQPEQAPGDDAPKTRGGSAVGRDEIITELEHLLGPRAREVVSPPRRDLAAVVGSAHREGFVVQYHCPSGIREGADLYLVWSSPDADPRLAHTRLSRGAAERLNVLRGARLLHHEPSRQGTPLPEGLDQVRGLGPLSGGPQAEANRRLARRTTELWATLDRQPQLDPLMDEVASALFPTELLAALAQVAGELPPRLLVVPSPWLWNLPWAGLTTPDGGRLLESARVSLSFSLSSLVDAEATRIDRVSAWIPAPGSQTVRGTGVERTMVHAMFGADALAGSPQDFLDRMTGADAAFASVHGQAAIGLAHGLHLDATRLLTAADLIALDLPATLIIGSCWSSRIDPEAEPFALPLIAHARGTTDIIGGVFPLPDAAPFPTARLLTQLYPALLGADPGTALWLAQHEAHQAGAAPHTWAGLIHTTRMRRAVS